MGFVVVHEVGEAVFHAVVQPESRAAGGLWEERFRSSLVEDGHAARTVAAYIVGERGRSGARTLRGVRTELRTLRDLANEDGSPKGGNGLLGEERGIPRGLLELRGITPDLFACCGGCACQSPLVRPICGAHRDASH